VPSARPAPPPASEPPEVRERGGARDGVPQFSDRRLFMLLLAFTDCTQPAGVIDTVKRAHANHQAQAAAGNEAERPPFDAVIYHDLHDPRGLALLTISEEPGFFAMPIREWLSETALAGLTPRPAYTMMGRTYALGYEPDLEDTLLHRPRRTALNGGWPWAIWYPLRRRGSFAQLDPDQQRKILMEHGTIGMGFGAADLGHDVRLASFGLDAHDNDFTVGLMGRELAPLSKLVETMRKTVQTSQYLERLGPFFVGRAAWQSPDAR
jgi:chlorite dismutase